MTCNNFVNESVLLGYWLSAARDIEREAALRETAIWQHQEVAARGFLHI